MRRGIADDVSGERTALPALFWNAVERIERLDSDRGLEHAMLLTGLGLQKLRCHVADWACGRWTIQELEPALGEWDEIRVGLSRSPREAAIACRMMVGSLAPPA